MDASYRVTSTSSKSAYVDDIWLNKPDNSDDVHTRRVLRAEIVDNVHSNKARVKACIVHQRRHSKARPWEDSSAFNLAKTKAGEEVRLQLSAAETYSLYKELEHLLGISELGVPKGKRNLIVTDKNEAVIVQGTARDILQRLLNEAGDELWSALKELQPELLQSIALLKLHEIRKNAVKEFATHLDKNDWGEEDWQQFFEKNTWIFGYGLTYHFLSTIESQPNYGGANFKGHDSQRGDFLAVTEAERRFTVLIEIKRPNTPLLLNKLYRNKTHMISGDLAGGVSQVQTNCRTWEIEGAQTVDNRDLLEEIHSYTIQPKGILIIGHTAQLENSAKRTTFELYRRNLQNPEVITYDELLKRAQHILLKEEKKTG